MREAAVETALTSRLFIPLALGSGSVSSSFVAVLVVWTFMLTALMNGEIALELLEVCFRSFVRPCQVHSFVQREGGGGAVQQLFSNLCVSRPFDELIDDVVVDQCRGVETAL